MNAMRALTKYRLDLATEHLETAKIMVSNGHCKDSVSCSYFSMFNAVRALLAAEQANFKTFLSIIRHFRREYIKTGIFDVKFSDYIGDAFNFRNDCDYEDFVIVSRLAAETQYQHAVEFVEVVKNFLEEAQNVCEDTGSDKLPAADD